MTSLSEFLSIGPGQVRALLLHPGHREDPIVGTLGSGPLAKVPNFSALSYTWGLRTKDKTVEIRGLGTIEVTDNLFSALRTLRHETMASWIWVDALCIDQKNEKEKDDQVLFMRQIYAKATRVQIWLGEESEEARKAIEFMQEVASGAQNLIFPTIPMSAFNPENWKNFQKHFLSSPWFERAWTFQEVAVSSTEHSGAIAMFGKWNFLWSDFTTFVNGISLSSFKMFAPLIELHKTLAFGRATMIYRDRNSLDLLPLLCSRRACKATDPRDMVYAHLGISTEGQQYLLKPNYKMPVEEVFAATTKMIIHHTESLDILSTISHSAQASRDMPSWAFDMRTPVRDNPIASLHTDDAERQFRGADKKYSASGETKAVEGSVLWNELALKGKLISRIAKLDESMIEFRETGLPQMCIQWLKNVEQLEGRYPNRDEKYLDAFSRTLIADQDVCTSWTNHRADREIRSTFGTVFRDPDFQGRVAEGFRAGLASESKKRISTYLHMLEKMCSNRRFFVAANGCIGLAPLEAQVGDMICVLFGAEVPYILRGKDGRVEYIGDAYFHGYMDSEAVKNVSIDTVFFMME